MDRISPVDNKKDCLHEPDDLWLIYVELSERNVKKRLIVTAQIIIVYGIQELNYRLYNLAVK